MFDFESRGEILLLATNFLIFVFMNVNFYERLLCSRALWRKITFCWNNFLNYLHDVFFSKSIFRYFSPDKKMLSLSSLDGITIYIVGIIIL